MSASWVIIHRETGEAVRETFSETLRDKVLTTPELSTTYRVVPILDYLVSINGKAAGGTI